MWGWGFADAHAVLTNNEISGFSVGAATDQTSGNVATLDVMNNTGSIHGNAIGIDVDAGVATITGNHIYDNSSAGVRLINGGSATISNNDFEGAANPDNGADVQLDSTAGAITSPVTGNTFAGAEFIHNGGPQSFTALTSANTYKRDNLTVETNDYNIEARIYHKVDNAASGLVTWHANNIYVTPAPSPTATDNDYTRIANAISSVSTGTTVHLKGSFDWTESNAAASWAKGNDANSGTSADNYSVLVPPSANNVTVTADSLGDATIQGPGDLVNSSPGAFLVFRGGPDTGLDHLQLDDQELRARSRVLQWRRGHSRLRRHHHHQQPLSR